MSVMVYGYLQLYSVLLALKKDKPFGEILAELGLTPGSSETVRCELPITSENAEAFLNSARENLIRLGIDVPEIRIQLLDDPMIQCARSE